MMKIHHIGYLVDDIEAAAAEFALLGFSRTGGVSKDSSREVYIQFLDNNGYTVELIQPVTESSPIYGLRKKYRNSPYHLCYETSGIEDTLREMERTGYTLIQPPEPAPAIPGCPKVAFLMNKHIGMIEIIEIKGDYENAGI